MDYKKINSIKSRQICFLFIAFVPTNKIFLLPSIIANYSKEMFWITMSINFIFDLLTLLVILKLNKLFPNKTFFAILKENFGKSFAKAIYFLFGIFFLIKSFIPLMEQKYFIDNILYEVAPNIFVFFPICLVTFYASIKGLRVIGRCVDISVWFTIFGLLLVFYLSVGAGDYSNLLPFISKLNTNVFKGSYDSVIWYGESIYMLLFLGHFDENKKYRKKIFFSYFGVAIAMIIFTAIFYSIFFVIAKTQFFALADMTVYSISIANVGRFDYLAVFAILLSSVFGICYPVFASCKSFERAFDINAGIYPALVINLILAIVIAFLGDKLFATITIFQKYINWFFIFMCYVLPFALLLALKGRRKYEKV